jgi:hypothetical protein
MLAFRVNCENAHRCFILIILPIQDSLHSLLFTEYAHKAFYVTPHLTSSLYCVDQLFDLGSVFLKCFMCESYENICEGKILIVHINFTNNFLKDTPYYFHYFLVDYFRTSRQTLIVSVNN